ncbi:MAG: WG repeat-containing protein [Bryobacteraceae bacterium]|nr:WG repeat-containing protein [Bryobacteraceae bacterium]
MAEDLAPFFAVLDLKPDANAEDIKAAYVDLVKVWHPDRFTNESERLRQRAERKIKEINQAYEKIRQAKGLPMARPAAMHLTPLDFGGRWGYVDETGAPAIYPEFAEARAFKDGLAAVKVVEKWGFIDIQGEVVIGPVYDEVGDFAEGLVAAKWYGRWGYIDQQGRFVIQPRYQGARAFENGWAEVQLGARWGKVNRQGEAVFAATDARRQI